MLLEKAKKHAVEIRQAGAEAAKLALAAGVPVYYFDDSLGESIIKEMPDGTRFRIAVDGSEEIVPETASPKL
jgi:hypothetical protein